MHTPEGEQDDSRLYGEPAPKEEASDHLDALNKIAGLLSLIIIHGSISHAKYGDAEFLLAEVHDCAAQARLALSLLPAVRREATSAGWDAAVKALRENQTVDPHTLIGPMDAVADHLATNKPQDITPGAPVALLLAEAERLRAVPYVDTEFYTDYQERQRRARCYQDAAELLLGRGA